MAKYSYYLNSKWIDIRAKNINVVRAKLIKNFGSKLESKKIKEIWIAKDEIMVGCVSYSRTRERFEYGDNHVPYGRVNPKNGMLTYDA